MIRFAFAGRCSTEDLQDPEASRNWQFTRAKALVEPAGGEIVAEYFDIGHSRSLPWQRRPRANQLLQALRNPQRGFDAVVIGEPQRTFYGNQFGNTFPIFVHFRVPLWVPEVGGPIDPDNEAHDLVMSVFGGMSKGERNRIKIRVRTAMSSQVQLQGRYLGGRPPYGYRIADAGPHPHPAKAATGARLHRLEPDPETAPVVLRLFQSYVDGASPNALAAILNREGIPCPSAHDAARNPHRAKTAWQSGAIRAILRNPRYTGHEVWNKQRKEEQLIDVEEVTLGHRTRMAHNPEEKWVWSNDPAHEPIISTRLFEEAQKARRERSLRHGGRPERDTATGNRPYILRGRIRCAVCGRKMQPAVIRDNVYYRCEFRETDEALHPGLEHPRTVYLREDTITPHLDRWIARAFAPDRLTPTLTALTHAAAAAAKAAAAGTPEEDQARRTLKECDKRLARYRAALAAGADPTVVTQWINDAQNDKRTALVRLEEAEKPQTSAVGGANKNLRIEKPLTEKEIIEIAKNLGDVAQRLQSAEVKAKAALYEALGITVRYENATRTATVRSRPSHAYRWSECPRGDLNPHAR
ncbi:recombinase family protein [Streptomyces sp. MJP52]|uniref:recombinase family protein n=1 Tax=Streptomyces sp. MJP52 TaxID=2940555 RepID=UPI002475471C|nr:recombinase family protein [Streptomyces sp. MJP52]